MYLAKSPGRGFGSNSRTSRSDESGSRVPQRQIVHSKATPRNPNGESGHNSGSVQDSPRPCKRKRKEYLGQESRESSHPTSKRRKVENAFDVIIPPGTWANMRGGNSRAIPEEARTDVMRTWDNVPRSFCMTYNYPPHSIADYFLQKIEKQEEKRPYYILVQIYYAFNERTQIGELDVNPCISETCRKKKDGMWREGFPETRRRGLLEELNMEEVNPVKMDRIKSPEEMRKPGRNDKRISFSVYFVSELKEIPDGREGSSKTDDMGDDGREGSSKTDDMSDDGTRKSVSYILGYEDELSELCKNWDPFKQTEATEQEDCVGIGMLPLTDVYNWWIANYPAHYPLI